MKASHIMLMLSLLIIILSGCNAQTNVSEPTKVSSKCLPSYDGTWKGVISDSGSILVTRFSADGVTATHNPFTAQYDFEMTIECVGGADNHYSYKVIRTKASHPLFECTTGCMPVYGEEWPLSWVDVNNGKNSMHITFPNHVAITAFQGPGSIEFSPDGQKMTLYIVGGAAQNPIGITQDGQALELDNCIKLGGDQTCLLEYINKNTIVLNKIN